MSKIKEMANKATAYIPENEVLDMDGCVYTTIDEVAKTWYMLGANAVLEEIEKVIDTSKFYSDMSTNTRLYDDLVNKIEELKKK